MDDATRIWREKSDDDLIEAAAELDQFTEEGQRIIRAELKRRHLEDPDEQRGRREDPAGEAEPEPECLRCHVPLRLIEAGESKINPSWTMVPSGVRFDPAGSVYAYVCPRCGHVDLFMDLPAADPAS
jgi:hypothetical protein